MPPVIVEVRNGNLPVQIYVIRRAPNLAVVAGPACKGKILPLRKGAEVRVFNLYVQVKNGIARIGLYGPAQTERLTVEMSRHILRFYGVITYTDMPVKTVNGIPFIYQTAVRHIQSSFRRKPRCD